MQNKGFIALAIALLMFPQIAQTLYSPALADFALVFRVAPEAASQALTVYFLAFAVGVMTWGCACDRIGRRTALLCGLALYACASAAALLVQTFAGLLLTQALAALGVSAGSVVTQTMLRDRFRGTALAQVFSIVGMVLAASPAIGLFAGAALVAVAGYPGVMWSLLFMATLLLACCARALPETLPANLAPTPLLQTLRSMARDAHVWRCALLVAAFNIALFSYYALGPFLFQRLRLDPALYGYSGVLLALGTSLGAWLNRRLLRTNLTETQLVRLAAMLLLAGGLLVRLWQDSLWFLAPMLLIVLAFGIAIPNLLGKALSRYAGRLGTAGALFGLMYYLLIGAGMILAGWAQALGNTLLACGGAATLLALWPLAGGRVATRGIPAVRRP